MRRLLIEKIFIYILGFLFCFFTSLSQGSSSSNVEQEFLNNMSSIMAAYDYVKTDYYISNEQRIGNVEYVQNDNIIKCSYIVSPEKVHLKTIRAEFNLIDEINLNNIYSLLSKLYDEDISIYSNEIQKMISLYTTTGEDQLWHDLNNSRQLTLGINKATSKEKKYQFYYSITAFNYM